MHDGEATRAHWRDAHDAFAVAGRDAWRGDHGGDENGKIKCTSHKTGFKVSGVALLHQDELMMAP
jgi:hypothetical protein